MNKLHMATVQPSQKSPVKHGPRSLESEQSLHVAVDCRLMFYRRAGIANYTRRLVQALAALDDDGGVPLRTTVLLDRRDADLGWLPAGVRVRRTVTPAHHPAEAWTLPLELAALDLRERIDVVHFPDFIACRGRFRKVVTVHDLYFLEHPQVMTPAAKRYYGAVAASVRRADRVIAVSQFTRSDVARLLPECLPRTHVVLEAADEAHADGAFREFRRTPIVDGREDSLRTPDAPRTEAVPPYALFVGTFEPRKNLDTLLQALARTPEDVRLVVVGEAGWGESEPAAIARALGVSERVRFVGRVDDAALDRWYRGARMLVHPRGARHMIDPSALWAGATAVYGPEEMACSYGEVVPVPAERVVASADGMTVEFGGRPLAVADTPGHARHHHCIWDEATRGWFTGDTFGLSYREFDSPARRVDRADGHAGAVRARGAAGLDRAAAGARPAVHVPHALRARHGGAAPGGGVAGAARPAREPGPRAAARPAAHAGAARGRAQGAPVEPGDARMPDAARAGAGPAGARRDAQRAGHRGLARPRRAPALNAAPARPPRHCNLHRRLPP